MMASGGVEKRTLGRRRAWVRALARNIGREAAEHKLSPRPADRRPPRERDLLPVPTRGCKPGQAGGSAAVEGDASTPANRKRNRALLRAGRLLTELNFSQRGTFRQDAALDVPPIPDLAAATRALAAAAPGSDAEGVALVSLVRARNRTIWALREAARELQVIAE